MYSLTIESGPHVRIVGFPDKCSTVQLLLTGRVTHRGEIVLQRCEPKSFVTRGEPTRSRTTEQPTNSKSFECRFNVAGTQEYLVAQLRTLRLYTYPGATNFLLVRFQSMPEAQARWEQLILDQGIVLIRCANFEGLSHDDLRCAVRDEQNSRLIDALRPWQMGRI
jgi:hypothetical protein